MNEYNIDVPKTVLCNLLLIYYPWTLHIIPRIYGRLSSPVALLVLTIVFRLFTATVYTLNMPFEFEEYSIPASGQVLKTTP